MECTEFVTIKKLVEVEEDVEVTFELDDYCECNGTREKINFIKEQTKKQYPDAKKVYFDKDNLSDLEQELADMYDTSDFHPNESYEEFMEHEDFD